MLARLQALLPGRWFPDTAPVRDGVLAGLANAWAAVYALWSYAAAQTRLATASDGFLDLISRDLFGLALPRRPGEADGSFRARIGQNLLFLGATRAGLTARLLALTGRAPVIFEQFNPGSTGALGNGTLALGAAGGLGNLELPFQEFVTAYRASGSASGAGVAGLMGLYPGSGPAYGGLGHGAEALTNATLYAGQVTDADIYAAIAAQIPAGNIAWTRISN